MQIVVNTRLLLIDRLEGIGWFAFQTLRRICKAHPEVHFVFLFDRPYDEGFVFSDNVTPMILSPPARHPVLYVAWFEWSVRNLLNRLQPDLFLSPDGFLSLGAKCRQLAVIHDINFFHNPRHSKWLTSRYYNYFFPRFARKATRIATVSNFSRNDIAVHYGVDMDKIDVVYNGINAFFRTFEEAEKEKTRTRFTAGHQYFISVGSIHPRKNTINLVRAFAQYRKKGGTARLLLAGPLFWGVRNVRREISKLGMSENVVITGRVSNEDLAALVGAALGMTFVPAYEGFGIPLLEAMASDVPIVASNTTSIPEVAGGAALLVSLFHPGEIADAMLRVESEPGLRDALIEKGREQRKHFSWDRTAELLWESVLKAVDQPKTAMRQAPAP